MTTQPLVQRCGEHDVRPAHLAKLAGQHEAGFHVGQDQYTFTEYLGERPALSVRKTSLRRIPYDLNTENGWHQDGAFLGEGIRTMNFWIALTDCGVDAPSMDMVPNRLNYIVPTGTEGAQFDWSVSSKMIAEVCDGGQPTHLNFKAGDAIVFDEMNLHRTSTLPEMTKDRYAIEAWFFAPSCYPMDQLPLMV